MTNLTVSEKTTETSDLIKESLILVQITLMACARISDRPLIALLHKLSVPSSMHANLHSKKQ